MLVFVQTREMTIMGKMQKGNNKSLSKSQNKKLKFGKPGKKEFKRIGKRGRLIVRNLPFESNEEELEKHFRSFGQIKEIQLLRRPNNKLVGCGFVEYTSRLNADKAVEQLNGKPFLGRPIYIERAVARDKYDEPNEEQDEQLREEWSEKSKTNDFDLDKNEIKKDPISDDEDVLLNTPEIKQEELSSEEEVDTTKRERKRFQDSSKDENTLKNLRKGRLIIRNLSFKSTEEKLNAYFSQFGEITEVKLLRRPDNTLVGCGFVQFTKKLAAAKAIHHTSGKPFLGRPIIVDWAIAKDKFTKMKEESLTQQIKKEDESEKDVKPIDFSANSVKKEESDSDSEEESKQDSDSSESDKEEDEEDDDTNDSDENEVDLKTTIKQEEDSNKRKRSDDIDEGKTVFVKNLPFSVDNTNFQECMEQFGPVHYALVCKDKFTEHSKGSGFVKFKSKDDADKCLSAGTELTLKGNILDPHPALKRDEAQKLKDKGKGKKDNRNLYLVKEGLIIAGTPAARGVSVADMERRLQLEQWKTTKLRNLNMFVSQNRLVIHNLPPTYSDKQLRKLLLQHTGLKATITEVRVMRDLKHVDNKGAGVSKGYGFISFEKHEDALKALRSINNNPTIFTPTARPIVAFSIENRSVLNTKKRRMVKSKQKNPLCKDYKPDEKEKPVNKSKHITDVNNDNHNEPEYTGIAAKPGTTVKMRQMYKLKNQAQQHLQDVKKQKREMKMSRKVRRTEHIKNKQDEKKSRKQKIKSVDNDVAFSNLINKYKTKLISQTSEKKKWYDD